MGDRRTIVSDGLMLHRMGQDGHTYCACEFMLPVQRGLTDPRFACCCLSNDNGALHLRNATPASITAQTVNSLAVRACSDDARWKICGPPGTQADMSRMHMAKAIAAAPVARLKSNFHEKCYTHENKNR